MMLRLTSEQMLRTWREIAGLEPLNTDCSIERFDGIDLDSVIRLRMRLWYLAMLDEGRPEYAGPACEASDKLTLSDGIISADPSVRRITSVRLSTWTRDAVLHRYDEVCGLVALLDNPYSAAGPRSPLAWIDSNNTLRVSPCPAGATISSAKAYIDPGEDLYLFDERALSTIPTNIHIP